MSKNYSSRFKRTIRDIGNFTNKTTGMTREVKGNDNVLNLGDVHNPNDDLILPPKTVWNGDVLDKSKVNIPHQDTKSTSVYPNTKNRIHET